MGKRMDGFKGKPGEALIALGVVVAVLGVLGLVATSTSKEPNATFPLVMLGVAFVAVVIGYLQRIAAKK